MRMRVTFPGSKRVQASFDGHVVETDQPPSAGGAASAPGPFDLFLASLATCAGYFILAFCEARGLPTEGLTLEQISENEPGTNRLARVAIDVSFPAAFPSEHREGVLRAADACKVKKMLAAPPDIVVRAAGA